MEKIKYYTPRVWQVFITILLVLALFALFVPGIHYHDIGDIGYDYYEGHYTYTPGRSTTYSFHDANATETIFPTLLTAIAMIGGIACIWNNKPKGTTAFACIYMIDEIIYIVSVTKEDDYYTFVEPELGFFIFSAMTLALVVFCIIAIKKTKEGKRPGKEQVVVAQTVVAPSNADELKKYKQLLDDGTITQEEFEAKKKQLL